MQPLTQVGDVAARSGVKVTEAERTLQALAYDTQATLEVSASATTPPPHPPHTRGRLKTNDPHVSVTAGVGPGRCGLQLSS